MNKTLIEQIGGIEKLREIINNFVDRVFDDLMIGFFFRKADRKRIKEKEFEFMANFLGADLNYSGLPLQEAHQKHRIMGGQFARRKQILKETLEEFQISQDIIEHILEHNEKLRPLITRMKNADCLHQEKNS